MKEHPLPNIHPNGLNQNEPALGDNIDVADENIVEVIIEHDTIVEEVIDILPNANHIGGEADHEVSIGNDAIDEEDMADVPSANHIGDEADHEMNIQNDTMDEDMIDFPSTGDTDCVDPLNIKNENQTIDFLNRDNTEDVPESLNGQYEVVDDEITIFYDDLSAFTPITSQMQIKRSDAFSGTLPYKEYVRNF